jgi:hypothetical protein
MCNIKRQEEYNLVEEVLKFQDKTSAADYDEEDAYRTLDRVNFWLNSFDTKASYLLAIIGIIGTILFTTGYFNTIDLQVWCSCKSGLLNALFLLMIISFLFSSICLIWCIKPNIKNIKPLKNECKKHTVLFYGSIADMKNIEEINNITKFSKDTIIDDINNQSWFCSNICIKKKKYIFWAICGITFCLVLFTLTEIVKHL